MKPMQKRIIGLAIVLGAILTSSLVLAKRFEKPYLPDDEVVAKAPEVVKNGSAIAFDDKDIYVVESGIITQLDRATLTIKNKRRLSAPITHMGEDNAVRAELKPTEMTPMEVKVKGG